MTKNTGAIDEPAPQGYICNPDYNPFGDGTRVWFCPECGAVWNADDLHLDDCSRRENP